MKMLGFDSVIEVAIGADMCTIEEAMDFQEKVLRIYCNPTFSSEYAD